MLAANDATRMIAASLAWFRKVIFQTVPSCLVTRVILPCLFYLLIECTNATENAPEFGREQQPLPKELRPSHDPVGTNR